MLPTFPRRAPKRVSDDYASHLPIPRSLTLWGHFHSGRGLPPSVIRAVLWSFVLNPRSPQRLSMAPFRRPNPTLRRTPAQKRAIERIRRLEPLDQIRALLEPGVVSYVREGPGDVYFTAQLPAHDVQKQHLDRLPDQLIVKWGESSCLPRRQLQYDDCAVGRTHMWISAFHVKRRLLAGEFFVFFRLVFPASAHLSCFSFQNALFICGSFTKVTAAFASPSLARAATVTANTIICVPAVPSKRSRLSLANV
ncbi:hypothetical protein B0H12DRAFT_1242017 [Mycena haematopus]|nr:hypothetical protein B0H12DRAFT_1242017 [Mycena haematopus]